MTASLAPDRPQATHERPEPRRICRDLPDVRCRCGKLLFRAILLPGNEIEAWCERCKSPVFIFIPPSIIVER